MAIRMTAKHDLVDDRRLAERIVGGDDEAFEDLVRRHFAQISRITGRFFRRPEVAEDVVQEVFIKAFSSMGTYRAEMPLEHWLSRITVNACYDQLRRSKRRPETPVSEIAEDPAAFYERLRAPEDGATSAYWQREEARLCAEELLGMLAPAERLVLTLMVLEDLSAAEVAKVTGWSIANVKVRAFRARGRLRKLLAAGDSARGR
jgi:RNA polymerase sigma-70 factor (ECF subfamily)